MLNLTHPETDLYAYCPLTLDRVKEAGKVPYSCGGYHGAHFHHSSGCEVLPLATSMAKFFSARSHDNNLTITTTTTTSKKQPKITLSGDSLTAQMSLVAQCATEEVGYPVVTNSIWVAHMTTSLPCLTECHNATYRQVNHGVGCDGCPDGKEVPVEDGFGWLQSLVEDEEDYPVLILSTGPHWNTNNHIQDPRETFTKTMEAMYTALLVTLESKGWDVYVIGVPWVAINGQPRSWGWHDYAYFNNELRRIFANAPSHLTLIDHEGLSRGRKVLEKANGGDITSDQLHYCNPGQWSMPHFIFESIMHLHALKSMRKLNEE